MPRGFHGFNLRASFFLLWGVTGSNQSYAAAQPHFRKFIRRKFGFVGAFDTF